MNEIKKHQKIYFLLGLILVFSAFFRLYRLGPLLGFYYDQGRDALKAQDILHLKDLPAIGPTTGIAGLSLGPFWFYLLAFFYGLGGGNPVVAAGLVALFDVACVFLIYWLGKEFYERKMGLLAAFFWGFSFYLTRSARWFSNPSPLPFFVVLLLFSLGKYLLKKEEKYLLLIFLCLAVSLQLQMASAFFFLPVLLTLFLVFKPRLKKKKYLLLSLLIFFAFLLPQALFEIKNDFLMTRNFLKFNQGEINAWAKTWAFPTFRFLKQRTGTYFTTFFTKLVVDPRLVSKLLAFFWLLFILSRLFSWSKIKKELTFILIIFLFLPLLLLFFFVGNYGQLYDYYLTGFFPPFIILFARFVSQFSKKKILLPFFLFILLWFLNGNLIHFKGYLRAGVDGPTHITLGNQLQAIDWIYQDAKEQDFNLEIYVPPVIPYAYQYLLSWYGQSRYQRQPVAEKTPLLYTLYEVDSRDPRRFQVWLDRQEGIGQIIKSQSFGGITVQKRERI